MSTTTEHRVPTTATAPPQGDRLVGGTLLALAVMLAAYQVVTAPFIPVLTVFMVVYGAVGVAIWRRGRRWLLVSAIVLAVAYLGGGLPVFTEHLAHPESPLGFLADAFIILALAVVVLGALARLRGTGERGRLLLAAGATGLAAVAVAAVAAVNLDAAARQPDDVVIEVVDWVFPDVDASAATSALWVDNHDPFHHTLVVEGTDVRGVLPASTAARVPVDLAPGSYRYFCDVPGHEAMTGRLDVH